MNKLVLVRPGEEYAGEILAYRQEFIDAGDSMDGTCRLRKYTDPLEWIALCRLVEKRETLQNPDWVETDQYMLVREGAGRVLGMINFRRRLNSRSALPSVAKAMPRLCLGSAF